MFKAKESASYDGAAAEYGRQIERLAGPLATEVCRLAEIVPAWHVLDVGCGTGVVARRAAVLVGARGRVVGVDISDGMLDEARRASGAAIESGVLRYQRMDAECLELDDGSFDTVVSLCAVLHFPRLETALAEMRRVLRPGGTLVVGFGTGRPIGPRTVAAYAMRRALVKIRMRGRPAVRGPGLLLRLSSEELPEPEAPVFTTWPATRGPLAPLVEALRAAGFLGIRTSWVGHEVRYESAADLWAAQTAIVTEVRARIVGADAALVERLRQRFDTEVERVLARGGTLVYPYGAALVCARS